MSIGAVKGIEIGDGFAVATSTGSKDNDGFKVENGHISKHQTMPEGFLVA